MLWFIHGSGFVKVPSASFRMVSFDTFENEIISDNLSFIEKGITPSFTDFNDLMYAIVKKWMNTLQKTGISNFWKPTFIFVCRYRKQLLKEVILMIQLNPAFYEESDNSKFSIDIMESDKDRIHLLISYSPDISLTFINQKAETEIYSWIME